MVEIIVSVSNLKEGRRFFFATGTNVLRVLEVCLGSQPRVSLCLKEWTKVS